MVRMRSKTWKMRELVGKGRENEEANYLWQLRNSFERSYCALGRVGRWAVLKIGMFREEIN